MIRIGGARMVDATVLVTGATGFIAGHCVQHLLEHGYRVRGTVRDPATADVAHLRAVADRTGGRLELVPARLDDDAGWPGAVAGCDYVWHVASPNPAQVPADENDVIRPAVDGTMRVLRAAAGSATVRRVVLTSSMDAVTFGHGRGVPTARTEQDWSDVESSGAYQKSKVYAERAAWDFVDGTPLELVTVLPGLVLGPLQHPGRPTSLEVVRLLLAAQIPAVPKLDFAVVDARDVAAAHRLAMEVPAAAGQRYLAAGQRMWMGEIAQVLAQEYRPRGYKVPTRPLPYWAMWVLARFDKTLRLALDLVGEEQLVSTEKAQRELGWSARPAKESILDAAQSLIDHAVVRHRG
jgi:nucleoside-diphosphate-sugar epimerase